MRDPGPLGSPSPRVRLGSTLATVLALLLPAATGISFSHPLLAAGILAVTLMVQLRMTVAETPWTVALPFAAMVAAGVLATSTAAYLSVPPLESWIPDRALEEDLPGWRGEVVPSPAAPAGPAASPGATPSVVPGTPPRTLVTVPVTEMGGLAPGSPGPAVTVTERALPVIEETITRHAAALPPAPRRPLKPGPDDIRVVRGPRLERPRPVLLPPPPPFFFPGMRPEAVTAGPDRIPTPPASTQGTPGSAATGGAGLRLAPGEGPPPHLASWLSRWGTPYLDSSDAKWGLGVGGPPASTTGGPQENLPGSQTETRRASVEGPGGAGAGGFPSRGGAMPGLSRSSFG